MRVLFPAFSPLLVQVVKHIKKGKLGEGSTLRIDLKSTPDLYSIGRLLALVKQLRTNHDIMVEFVVHSKKIMERLHKLGFLDYCASQNVVVKQEVPQLELPFTKDTDSLLPSHQDKVDAYGGYFLPLIPLQRVVFKQDMDNREIASTVLHFLESIGNDVVHCLAAVGLTTKDFGLDLSKLIFGMIDEILSNTISHSQINEFLFAMIMSREAGTDIRPSTPGADLAAGADKIEFLAMDAGCGIFRSVRNTLGGSSVLANSEEYFSLAQWDSQFTVMKTKEAALLDNICRGELVIRRGRKSEGLRDVMQSCTWFGGTLNLRTGRSELLITSVGGPASVRPRNYRPERPSDFLPGVIAYGSLPMHQVHMAFLRKESLKIPQDNFSITGAIEWRVMRLANLPSGLLGGAAVIKARRKSENDAETILAHLEDNPSLRIIWNLDLKLSDNIDVDYLDSLIQELGKRIEDNSGDSCQDVFARIIFTNVPRNIIRELQTRNCSSFLMLKDVFCVFMDEADQVHFLGLPRASSAFFDLAEALSLIYFAGRIKASKIKVKPETLLHLTHLANSRRNFVECSHDKDELEFTFAPLSHALMDSRSRYLIELEEYRWPEKQSGAQEKPKGVFKLRNGKYVDCFYDFCLYWCAEDRLLDCTKLLLGHAGVPLVDTLLAFMHNGDRLAFAIQRFTRIANLIVVDPHNHETWKNLEIEGQCVLVVDALYPGDDSEGYVKEFVSSLHDKQKIASVEQIWALFDFRRSYDAPLPGPIVEGERISQPLHNVEVVSLKIPKELDIPSLIENPESCQSIVQKAASLNLSNHSGPETEPPDSPTMTYEFSPVELSTEFWQNVAALRIVESVRSGRESRSILFYENNERLIQNQRMRRTVVDFVADFVRNVIAQKADVILHPAHPIGAYLAQQVSCHLPQQPIVLPLRQPVYGGQIELTSDDYQYFRTLIKKRRHSSKGLRLNAVGTR